MLATHAPQTCALKRSSGPCAPRLAAGVRAPQHTPLPPSGRPAVRRAHHTAWRVQAAAGGDATGGGGAAKGGGGGGGGSGGGGSGGDGSGSSDAPHPMRLPTFVYAAILAAGGAFAYYKKGSAKSLMSAGGSALILALAARTMVGSTARSSVYVCLAVSILLMLVMANRFLKTKKMMPAGAMAGTSLLMSIGFLATMF